MKKLLSILILLPLVVSAQTNKFIAVGWNTNNAPVGRIPFVYSATSNGWTEGAADGRFLAASNSITPYPHFQVIYGSNIVGATSGTTSTNTVWEVVVATNYVTPFYYDDGELNGTGVVRVVYTVPETGIYRIDYSDVLKLESADPHDSWLSSHLRWTDQRGAATKEFSSILAPDETSTLWKFDSGSFEFHALTNTTITISNLIAVSWQSGDALSTNYVYYVLSRKGTGSGSSSSGSATNVYFLDSPSITWSTTGGSNVATLSVNVSNDWKAYTLAASNSITANLTNALNGISNSITANTTNFVLGTSNTITSRMTNYVTGTSNGLYSLIGSGGSGFATNGYGTFGGNAGGFTNVPTTPPQMPSTIWDSWSTPVLLLTNGNSIQDSNHLAEASIGNIGTTMALYYTSYDGGSTGRIWSAYGSLKDGFVKHGITLAPTPGAWDGSSIGGATHYRENGTNYLFYFGGTNFSPGSFELDPLHIGVAYSTDGTNYTKVANPILRTTDVVNSITLYIFFCKKVGTNYLGYFNAKYASGAEERINLATAPSPLGPWTYYGQIYHHTNATITSDFTVQDLPSGGYIGAYWINTNGTFQSAAAYSEDLINWRYAGTLGGGAPGTRLFYDDGIALSYTANQTSVYYVRPNRASLGRVLAESVTAGSFIGAGAGLSNVAAATALKISSEFGTAGNPVLGGSFDGTNNYWVTWGGSDPLPNNNYSLGYSQENDHWFTRGGFQFGDFISLTNHTGGSNTVMLSHLGSRINGVGFTNNVITANGSGLSNAVDIIAGSNITVTTNANNRSFTIASSGSGTAVTFNPNQFGSSSIGTNLLDGVLITNPVIKITTDVDHTILQSTEGGPAFISYGVSPDTLYFGHAPIGDGSGWTNLNAANISGNLNIDTLTVSTQIVTGTLIGNGSGLTNQLIETWTFGYFVTQTSAGIAMIPNAPGASFNASSGNTNIGVTLYRPIANCYLSNLNIGYYNASGTGHAGSNYVVSISTNSVLDTSSSTLFTNVANAGMNWVTNTSFSTILTKNQAVGFMLINTNAGHSPASQTLIGTVGVYSR